MIYDYNGPESGIQQWLEIEMDLLVLTTFEPYGPPRGHKEAFKKAVYERSTQLINGLGSITGVSSVSVYWKLKMLMLFGIR